MNKTSQATNFNYQKKLIADYQEKVSKQVKEINIRCIEKYEKFYYFIASLCGGSIVLSITLLGNIYTSVHPTYFFGFSHYYLLYFSWLLLVLALVSSLYRNLCHSHYLHWYSVVENLVSRKKGVDFTLNIPEEFSPVVANADEINVANLLDITTDYKKLIDKHDLRRKVYEQLTRYLGKASLIMLSIGVFLLISFAIISIEILSKSNYLTGTGSTLGF